MSEHLRRECGKNSANKKMLKVTQKSLIVRAPCCEKHIDELYCIFVGKVHVPVCAKIIFQHLICLVTYLNETFYELKKKTTVTKKGFEY